MCAFILSFLLLSVTVPEVENAPVQYRIESGGDLSRFGETEIAILEKLNRRSPPYLRRAGQIVVADRFDLPELAYSPLPRHHPPADTIGKFLIVHKPSQVFGAYEFGRLVRWGPVSTGRRAHRTPDGLFHLTWRSRGHTSSINASWFMPWYFNFHNTRGLAFHEYALPGRPASHACIRLLQRDAKWLYEWGETWILANDEVVETGTPVLIVGNYDFTSDPPWLSDEYWLNTPLQIDHPEHELVLNATGSP